MPTSTALKAFAEDPAAFLPGPPGGRTIDDPRFCLRVTADGRSASVCRLRLGRDAGDAIAELRAIAPQARTTWVIGPSATPANLEQQLRDAGAHEQEPPLTSHVTALATDREPPAVDGVTVRRVETYDDFYTALELSIVGWEHTDERAERMRAEAPDTWARRLARSGGEWIAEVDGEPVAYAGAVAGPVGLYLTGGVTLPAVRGRGAYRALVRARWDDAARRGTPTLVVHAEEASRRVLVRIGFEHACDIVELVTDP